MNTSQQPKQTEKQKIILFLWSLWSWKTTLVQQIAQYLIQSWKEVSLIINDIGTFNIDAQRLSQYELEALTQWCICCDDSDSLRQSLQKKKEQWTKLLMIEPTGIAEWDNIIEMAEKLWFEVKVISLFNIAAYEDKRNQQLRELHTALADIVWLTHTQWHNTEAKAFADEVININSTAKIVTLPDPSQERVIIADVWEQIYLALTQTDSTKKIYQKPDTSHTKPKVKSIQWWESTSIENLESIITIIWMQNIQRAKGVVCVQGVLMNFDIVEWRSKITTNPYHWETIIPYMNIMTSEKLTDQQNEHIYNIIKSWNSLSQIPITMAPLLTQEQWSQAVKKLVEQYNKYMEWYNKKIWLESLLQTNNNQQTVDSIWILEKQLSELWDAMKFDNPYIWIK